MSSASIPARNIDDRKEILRYKEVEPAPKNFPEQAPQYCTVRLPLLKRGATGTAVESAQLLLIHRGYDCGGCKSLGHETPDGDFGHATEQSVKAFQTSQSLEPDGEIGRDTWMALLTR